MLRAIVACMFALQQFAAAQLGGNKTWNREAQLGGWPSRHSAALLVVDASTGPATGAFLLGGADVNEQPFTDVWYSEGPTQFVQWVQRAANVSYGPRSSSSGASDGVGLLLVSGGYRLGQRAVLLPPSSSPLANGTNTTGNATYALVNVTVPLDDAWVSTDGQSWTSISSSVWGPPFLPAATSLEEDPAPEPIAAGRFGHSTVWVPWAGTVGAWWLVAGFALPVNSSYLPPSPSAVTFIVNCSACNSSQALLYAANDVRQLSVSPPVNGSDFNATVAVLTSSAAWRGRGYAAVAALASRTGTGTGLVYMSGGVDWNSLTVFDDAWWSNDGSAWLMLQPASTPWPSRYHHGLVASAGVLWLVGGSRLVCTSSDGVSNSTQLYSCSQTAVGDVWRSDTPASPDVAITSWLPVESTPSATDLTRLWGPRTAFAAAATVNPALGGISLAGGVVYSPQTGTSSLEADLWSSTSNLLCEENTQVCSGAGRCAAQQPTGQDVAIEQGLHWLRQALLPLNCTCNAGYGGPRCASRVCDTRTCAFGTCSIDKRTGAPLCVCNDPSKYQGARCDVPVCAAGCSSVHGGCNLGPGRCDCEPGWVGPQCAVPDVWFIHVSQWIEQRAGTVFTGTAGLGLLFTSLCAMWMNVRASQPPWWAQASPDSEDGSASESTPLLTTAKTGTPRQRLRLLGIGPPSPLPSPQVSIGIPVDQGSLGTASDGHGASAMGWGTPGGLSTPMGGTGAGTPSTAEGGKGGRSSGKKKRVTFAAKEEYAPD